MFPTVRCSSPPCPRRVTPASPEPMCHFSTQPLVSAKLGALRRGEGGEGGVRTPPPDLPLWGPAPHRRRRPAVPGRRPGVPVGPSIRGGGQGSRAAPQWRGGRQRGCHSFCAPTSCDVADPDGGTHHGRDAHSPLHAGEFGRRGKLVPTHRGPHTRCPSHPSPYCAVRFPSALPPFRPVPSRHVVSPFSSAPAPQPFPLRFASVDEEVNFHSVLHLLKFGSAYQVPPRCDALFLPFIEIVTRAFFIFFWCSVVIWLVCEYFAGGCS